MIGGVLAVIVIYVLVNIALLVILPVPELAAAKLPAADAAKRIDLSAHREHYRNINGPGFQEATITRIYQVLDQRGGSN